MTKTTYICLNLLGATLKSLRFQLDSKHTFKWGSVAGVTELPECPALAHQSSVITNLRTFSWLPDLSLKGHMF